MKPAVKYSLIGIAVLLVIAAIAFTNLASHGLILVNEEGFKIDSKHLDGNESTLAVSIYGPERIIEIKEGIGRNLPYTEENLHALKEGREEGAEIVIRASANADAILLVETIDQLRNQGFNVRIETKN